MNQLQVNKEILPNDELILVLKRSELFKNIVPWQGIIKVDFEKYLNIIQQKKEFLPRSQMELDFSYKQIIPYLIFRFNNRLFLMQRRSQASETRLKNKFSLGIGGHIRQEDMSTDSIVDWAKREFYEEVDYKGGLSISPLGIINDDSNDVGKVHIGFVFLLEGDSEDIQVKSELKSGKLLSYDECKQYYESMETWSQIVLSSLC